MKGAIVWALVAAIASVCFGALARFGAWAVESITPASPQKVVVCYADDMGKVQECKTLREVLRVRQKVRKWS